MEKLHKAIDERHARERDKVNSFLTLVRDVAALDSDSKTFIANYLGKFLVLLDDILKISKDKRIDPEVQRYLLEHRVQTELHPVNDSLIGMLKGIVLQRLRDRSVRENAIKALKIMLKLNPALTSIFRHYKFHTFVSFILEREFKNSAVAKERMQCFKFIKAWLFKSPANFPLLFAQAIVGIVRNEEEFQLRFDAIDLMIEMCNRVPKIAAQVGAIKELIERLLDLTLEGYRYERISHALMLLINDPKIRIYFRP